MRSPKVVVVTGASAGVGRAVAREFGKRGAAVGLIARGREGLEAAAKEIEAAGGRGLVLPCDVADYSAVEGAADDVERELGPIDVWVNNAMTSVFAEFDEIRPDEFERVIKVTFLGTVNGTRAALERMRTRNRGVIVQVGSALAYRAIPLQSAYCSAKHAMKGFTESVRTELLHQRSGIRITMVHLPALNTPQFDWVLSRLPKTPQPVPPIYQPEVAARAVVLAARHPRREIWVGGSAAATILGNRIVPGLLDRYLGRTGYKSQQTDESADPNRPVNLWEPVPGDAGAHGRFDERAHAHSAEMWLAAHKRKVAIALVMAGAALVAAGRRNGR